MSGGKIIFMGRTGSGKTTLCQKLDALELKYKKTQSVEFYNNAIDTPGEYMENRNYYHALIMSAIDAKLIAILGDPTVRDNYIPPAFAGTFAKEIIGIVTKVTLVDSERDIKRVETELRQAGAQKVFQVDTVEEIGIEELFHYIHQRIDD